MPKSHELAQISLHIRLTRLCKNEPRHDKTNKMSVRPAKTQISLGIRPVWSVFAVRMKKPWALSYPLSAQRRLWSDWANAQADLSLRWAHTHFVDFVMSWLKYRHCFLGIATLLNGINDVNVDQNRFYAVKRLKEITLNTKCHSFTSEMQKNEEIMYNPTHPCFILLKVGLQEV